MHGVADNENPSVPEQGAAPRDHRPHLCMILQHQIGSILSSAEVFKPVQFQHLQQAKGHLRLVQEKD